jgi:AcrR family transcriptional regulator
MNIATDPKNARSRRTRTALLTAAREVVEHQGLDALTMAAVAERAGCSRRAVYLHFSTRTELLLALFSHVAEAEDLAGSLLPVRQATDAVTALTEWVNHLARYFPRIHAMAHAVDTMARCDPDADESRYFARSGQHDTASDLIAGLEREGRLAPGLTADAAADILFALSGLEVFERLTIDRRWSTDRYAQHLAAVLRATLVADVDSG